MSFASRARLMGTGIRMMAASIFGGGNAYEAGSWSSREMGGWHPANRGVDEDIIRDREKAVARARDLARNHPVVAGAIDRRAESVVGVIRLEAQPAFEAMGWTPDRADEWATQVETQFDLWSNGFMRFCDKQMRASFPEMVETAYRHWWTDGEALAVVNMRDRGGPFQTCIELVDPDRLSNPDGLAEGFVMDSGNTVAGGVETNPDGVPVTYHIRKKHPQEFNQDLESYTWVPVRRYGPTGRPQVVHALKRDRANQRRGISRFVAAIKRIKMFDRYDDAEVEAALLNAVMAVTIQSQYPTADVAQAIAPSGTGEDGEGWSFAKQVAYRIGNAVRMKGVNPIHLLPGEEMKFNRAERPSQNYPDFQATGLRTFAAQFGLSYAQVAQNWADINYSSGKLMMNEIWRGLLHDRWLFTQSFCTPIYAAWLEEAIAIGRVKLPGRKLNFYALRSELCMAEWKGPGRGTVDPLKEGQANEFELNMAVTSPSSICDSDGRPYRKVLQTYQRDMKLRAKFGLDEWQPLKGSGAGADAAADDSGSRDGNGKFSPKPQKQQPEEADAA